MVFTDLQCWPAGSWTMLATGAAEIKTLQGSVEDCHNLVLKASKLLSFLA